VYESDILGLIDFLSDIEYSVSFERAMIEDYSLTYRTNLFVLFMSTLK